MPLPLKFIFVDFDNRNWHASKLITLTKVLSWTRRCSTILIFVGDIFRGTIHNSIGNSLPHIWSALASIEQFDASLVRKNFFFNFSPITIAFYQQQDVLKCDKIRLQFWSSTSIKAAATLIKSAVKLKQHEKWVQNGREGISRKWFYSLPAGFVVILSCLAAAAIANPAQNSVEYLSNGLCRVNCRPTRPGWPVNNNECPPTNCPPPIIDNNCKVYESWLSYF